MDIPSPPPPLQVAEATLRVLRDTYGERPYHGWNHVRACMALFDPRDFSDPGAVWAAILFHDAIYEAGAKDNEERSALLALQTLDGATVDLDRVAALIRLTARHGSLDPQALDEDARRFLDIDMAILGAEPAIYDRYAAGVREEHAAVPDAAWALGRGHFLSTLLDSPAIYLSEWGRGRWETKARENLAREQARLG